MGNVSPLLDEIVSKTNARRLPWKPTASETTFVAALAGKYTLTITEQPGTVPIFPGYTLTVKSADGAIVAEFTAGTGGFGPSLFGPGSVTGRADAPHDVLRSIYESARRQAFNLEEKVQDLLSELKKL